MLRFDQVVTADGEAPFDTTVDAGRSLLLIGPSGGTRSRLLAVAAGLVAPRSGRVLLDDAPVQQARAGLVDEDRSLLGGLTSVENVVTRVLAHRPLRDGEWEAAGALLRSLDLPESSLHNLAEQLSGGQQQRVAIGRALFGRPALLCLDDPVSELDEASAALVWSVVADAVQQGAILLVGLPEVDPGAPASRAIDVRDPGGHHGSPARREID